MWTLIEIGMAVLLSITVIAAGVLWILIRRLTDELGELSRHASVLDP